jgi:hypothetical protein
MDITNIITNPIVIGLVAGLITYIYMKWKNDKKNKGKKQKEDINLMIPLAVFIVFWFISYAYFSSCDSKPSSQKSEHNKIEVKIRPSVKTTELSSSTSDPGSFELVGKTNGIPIPNELPDIFLEMEK